MHARPGVKYWITSSITGTPIHINTGMPYTLFPGKVNAGILNTGFSVNAFSD
jgi:hypothetical protein